MWFFNKKTTIAASGILSSATDHHSHILPGVDDGVETIDETLRILATYETLGIKTLWLTPHIMEDCPNSTEKLRARFERLKAAYNGCVELHLAAEYMIDNHLRKRLDKFRHSLEGRWHEQSVVTEGSKTAIPQGEISSTNDSPSLPKREYPQGEGDENNKFRPATEGRWHEQSEVTEGSKTAIPQGEISSTNNSPSLPKREYPQGEGDENNKLRPAAEGRWHEQSVVTEGSKTAIPQGEISSTNNSPSLLKREYPQGEGDENNKFRPAATEGVAPPAMLPIGTSGKHILVETSYYNAPMKMRDTLQQIKSLGYHPLLAHPERYMYLDNAEYTRLHSEGVKFQLNLASLAGGYGPVVKKKALWLLTNGLYTVAGSDLHSEDAIEFITKCKLSEKEIEQVVRLLHNRI